MTDEIINRSEVNLLHNSSWSVVTASEKVSQLICWQNFANVESTLNIDESENNYSMVLVVLTSADDKCSVRCYSVIVLKKTYARHL